MREHLPDTRNSVTQRFSIYWTPDGGEVEKFKGYITVGQYDDGRPGEIFLRVGKAGSSEALLDQLAVAWSLLLQNGVPLDEICSKFEFTQFEPFGLVKGLEAYGIRRCSSPVDLVAKYLKCKYLKAVMPVEQPGVAP